MADADVIVVGAGLAGLVAACELVERGHRVLILDQENAANLGGQAFWSFGGLFFVDSPEQRRLGIRDSQELALQDWLGTAGFDRPEDHWPREWAHAYVDFAAGEKRSWLRARGLQTFPLVGWAERGGYGALGHGNSVPRFHITWGTGPAIVDVFARRLVGEPRVRFAHRHRVDELIVSDGAVVGVRGSVLEPSDAPRGVASSRNTVGEFEFRASAVIVASGGIGGNHDLVRKNWPARMGRVPEQLLSGVPAHVDGRMIGISETAGARVINSDRMWHYTEGITNYDPIWPDHGIRILPGPSSLWLDANGKRLPGPLYPGFDTLGTLEHICRTGQDYTWFILDARIIAKEFALSGQEQNPDLTSRSVRDVLARVRPGAPAPVQAFVDRGVDFVSAHSLRELVAAMNDVPDVVELDYATVAAEVTARDREVVNKFTKDGQVTAIRAARNYLGDRFTRVVAPHRLTDPKAGPMIAVKLHILTRKSLGGLETDLDSRVLKADGTAFVGLYAAGEAAGFGGGGVHGYRSLEGTFLGGCIFSGRAAGRGAAADIA
ncbi:FAD-binding dehydrogenase [Mycolicibacterium fortuitum]|uniref:FAD-binding dehydrogenase n=1 Tax=Mycolicibacterium fortuitum subsp. fortuitum DSM 46621 = ATCC 6841 = JCM 6387 TaxID=1214102 RepID=K0UUW5_MYCFO|nr:FAD-binding dehydrogenase [Mycolicibacterium fortuitum]AIY45079.1 Fumarate/succinate/L-aspartate dehydrogenase [Mycobacterium sp. VKM Ac-1817D]CRL80261.1 FAD-binding dehydrogenase [Mycolicibacter nonchromogenicus]EJZ06378.1 FAD-binding dehydrogenase [Mycolicibacterium fortuitum subsp. fortuitum DSM 46621 = ATCC 6841 = JCM 6387]WEV33840.1 FAD-binding dehydrogenase [Mycolicibacterium fortuitum]CRL58349.1 FAD-binding dehydrogenase [Mycolicibacterium fortuitum subsp. fortuitum DSM 46621 = ATCC 